MPTFLNIEKAQFAGEAPIPRDVPQQKMSHFETCKVPILSKDDAISF